MHRAEGRMEAKGPVGRSSSDSNLDWKAARSSNPTLAGTVVTICDSSAAVRVG